MCMCVPLPVCGVGGWEGVEVGYLLVVTLVTQSILWPKLKAALSNM